MFTEKIISDLYIEDKALVTYVINDIRPPKIPD
jgi:hypothetical protein